MLLEYYYCITYAPYLFIIYCKICMDVYYMKESLSKLALSSVHFLMNIYPDLYVLYSS